MVFWALKCDSCTNHSPSVGFKNFNQACDRLAKQVREELPAYGPTIFENEGLSIWHGTNKLSHHIKSHIEHIYHKKKAEMIMCDKYDDWNREQFTSVNWKANGKAMQMLTVPMRILITKYLTKFLPVGRNIINVNVYSL